MDWSLLILLIISVQLAFLMKTGSKLLTELESLGSYLAQDRTVLNILKEFREYKKGAEKELKLSKDYLLRLCEYVHDIHFEMTKTFK